MPHTLERRVRAKGGGQRLDGIRREAGVAIICKSAKIRRASDVLAFVPPGYVAPAVSLFVTFEVGLVHAPRRLGLLAAVRHCALIAVIWMEGIIDVAMEAFGAMKPRTSAYKDAAREPLRTVISGGRTAIRSGVVVAVRTFRCNTKADADLCISSRDECREGDSSG
jgi:hypothetical protein